MDLYSPFDKTLAALDVADLSVLYDVQEGWYIEYKREHIQPKALAKAVAAFANTHGGWLFLGVDEVSEGKHTAEAFPGIDTRGVDLTLQWLRQAMNAHVSPLPHFESKVLQGPCDSIRLAADRFVIVVQVPESNNTPHVSSDGRIYIRVADSSEPQDYIKERFLLDELVRRGDRVREATSDWVDRDPEFSQDEADTPYVRLMFSPDLWHKRYRMRNQSLTALHDVLAGSRSGELAVTFDVIYPTADGIIARQTLNNDPRWYGPTFHLYKDWSSDVVIPLRCHSGLADKLAQELSERYQSAEQFVQILEQQRYLADQEHVSLDVVDVNALLYSVMGITTQYRALLQLAEAEPQFHFKARLLHVGRKIPYLDAPQIVNRYRESGVPMLLHNEITVPPGTDPESFVFLVNKDNDAGDGHGIRREARDQAVAIFAHLISAFGISGLVTDEGKLSSGMVPEVIAAAGRGVEFRQAPPA